MTDLNKLKEVAGMMILPTRITGVANLLAYPSPGIVQQTQPLPGKVERMEIKMRKSVSAQALHTSTITKDGKPTTLKVLPCLLSTPEKCVVCNRQTDDQGVLEALGPVKISYGKMTISGANASRIWNSLQCDRYWFTFPVCKVHQNDLNKKVFIDATPHHTLEIKLPNRAWGEEFIAMNQVDYVAYKSKEYLKKFKWMVLLLYAGIFGLTLAIIATIVSGAWFWIIPTLALVIGGFILLFKNRFQVLVAESSSDPEGMKDVPPWLEGIISMKTLKTSITATGFAIAFLGVLSALLKINGEYIALPWFVKAGIVVLGVLVFILGSLLGKKKKKKES